MNNCFIILAAGESKRFNSKTPKPYHLYKGKPLIQHSIDKAKLYKKLHKIIIVVNKKHKKFIKSIKIKNDTMKNENVIQNKSYGEARSLLEKEKSDYPGDTRLRYLLAVVYVLTNEVERAKAEYDELEASRTAETERMNKLAEARKLMTQETPVDVPGRERVLDLEDPYRQNYISPGRIESYPIGTQYQPPAPVTIILRLLISKIGCK